MRGDGQMRSNKTQTFFGTARDTQKSYRSLSARDVPIPFGFSFSFLFFFVLLLATSHLQKCSGEIRAREKRETRRMDRRLFPAKNHQTQISKEPFHPPRCVRAPTHRVTTHQTIARFIGAHIQPILICQNMMPSSDH